MNFITHHTPALLLISAALLGKTTRSGIVPATTKSTVGVVALSEHCFLLVIPQLARLSISRSAACTAELHTCEFSVVQFFLRPKLARPRFIYIRSSHIAQQRIFSAAAHKALASHLNHKPAAVALHSTITGIEIRSHFTHIQSSPNCMWMHRGP